MMDESQGPQQPFLQGGAQPPQQPGNPLGGLTRNAPPQINITKQQLIAGLHHMQAFRNEFAPLLNNPKIGKSNIRKDIFSAAATLMGAGIFTSAQVINGVKDLPDDPVEQKTWLETKLANTVMAEKKLLSDFINQGPGADDGPDYAPDMHQDHMAGLMGNYKRA